MFSKTLLTLRTGRFTDPHILTFVLTTFGNVSKHNNAFRLVAWAIVYLGKNDYFFNVRHLVSRYSSNEEGYWREMPVCRTTELIRYAPVNCVATFASMISALINNRVSLTCLLTHSSVIMQIPLCDLYK